MELHVTNQTSKEDISAANLLFLKYLEQSGKTGLQLRIWVYFGAWRGH